MSTFITRFDASGSGLRLAVKDLIDMEGVPTTAGCRAVADEAQPAAADARCMAGARAAGARVVGRTNLHELALGVTGVNPWFGTPVNPLNPALVPGGSSSGSAVAVATGEADVAYGSDTGGSVRIPSACCGTAGLKTTFGRVPLDGVWPLSPSFDTVGPMARDARGLETGMQLLEPGFAAQTVDALRVGRLRIEAEPRIDAAIDAALRAVEWDVQDLILAEWDEVNVATGMLLVTEAWQSNAELVQRRPDGIGDDVRDRLHLGEGVDAETIASARAARQRWVDRLDTVFRQFDVIATPTLTIFPPRLDDGEELLVARCTLPVNMAGAPAVALPVPTDGPLPASIQLIGATNADEQLVGAAMRLEDAIATL